MRPLSCRARASVVIGALLALAGQARASQESAGPPRLQLRPGDRIVLLGNTLAERQQLFNHFEALLVTRVPELRLVVRNLGWSGDTLTLQPRPLNFGDAALHLERQKADVIVACFGLNESFDGEAGLPRFEADLDAYIETHRAARYNGREAPRLVLVSPIAHERLAHLRRVDVDARNRELVRYTEAMRRTAARHGVVFADLFTPTLRAFEGEDAFTINGIHVNEAGDRLVARLLADALGLPSPARGGTPAQARQLDALRELVRVKNEEFFRRWRFVNAEYVVGRRVDPFGSVSFPPEMRALDERVSALDRQIWRRARALRGVWYDAAAPSSTAAEARR